MALISELVTRLRADVGDHVSKMQTAKLANKDNAKSLLELTGSAEKAIATLKIAKNSGTLGEFGIDKRQVAELTKEIKELEKAKKDAANGGGAEDVSKKLNTEGKRANAFGDLNDSVESFMKGDFLKAIEKYKKGMADLQETGGLGGAGATAFKFAAAGIIFDQLEKATGKAAELSNQFRKGEIDATDMAGGIARSIPILGSAIKMWDNIGEAISGDKAYLEEVTAEAKRLEAQIETNTKTLEAEKDGFRELAKLAGDINNETKLIGLEGLDKDLEQTRQNFIKLQQEIAKTAKDAGDKAAAPAEDQIKTLEAQRKEIENSGITPDAKAQKLGVIDADIAKNKATADQERQKETAAAQPAFQAAARKHIEEDTALTRKANEDDLKEKRAYFDKIADLEDKANADRLRGEGKQFEAEVAQAKAARDKEVEELHKSADERMKKLNPYDEQGKAETQDGLKRGIAAADAEYDGQFNKAQLDEQKRQDAEAKRQADAESKRQDLTDDADKLYRQKDDVEKKLANPDYAYQLPDVKELRAGQSLTVPPNKVDEQSLSRLTEILAELRKNEAKQAEASADVQVIN